MLSGSSVHFCKDSPRQERRSTGSHAIRTDPGLPSQTLVLVKTKKPEGKRNRHLRKPTTFYRGRLQRSPDLPEPLLPTAALGEAVHAAADMDLAALRRAREERHRRALPLRDGHAPRLRPHHRPHRPGVSGRQLLPAVDRVAHVLQR